MVRVEFVIHEVPVSWKRARTNGKRFFVDAKTAAWKASIANHFAAAAPAGFEPMEGRVELALGFILPFPKSWPKYRKQSALTMREWHTQKPDADNLAKGVMDALNGVAWVDDGQVCGLGVTKVWGPVGAVVVSITEVVE